MCIISCTINIYNNLNQSSPYVHFEGEDDNAGRRQHSLFGVTVGSCIVDRLPYSRGGIITHGGEITCWTAALVAVLHLILIFLRRMSRVPLESLQY